VKRVVMHSAVFLLVMTVILGVVYPVVITLLSQCFFPWRANGSVLVVDDHIAGSALLGQEFSSPGFFWGRLSSRVTHPSGILVSGASNLGPLNPGLVAAAAERIRILRTSDPVNPAPIPVDLVTASASGFDPHISGEAAFWQASRVAAFRNLDRSDVEAMIRAHIETDCFGLTADYVNVVRLNLDLERMAPSRIQ